MGYEAPSDLPAQAHAKALYPFKGKHCQMFHCLVTPFVLYKSHVLKQTNPNIQTTAEPAGSISMAESEKFDVIEYDQGDGWTRVRRTTYDPDGDDFIGFVPTSYIAIEPLPNSNSVP